MNGVPSHDINMTDVEKQFERIKRGAADLIPEEELLEKLFTEKPLRVKLGIDPSAPDITLGHAVVLRKLRQFQQFGHTAVLIVGDFTRRIGDPSGQTSMRPPMSLEEIKKNMQTYVEQVFKILDPLHTEIRYNSEWLSQLDLADLINLSSKYTVARILERDDFSQRFQSNKPITIMELLYPLAQAYDSVAIQADVELGGTDQKFNLLIGRDIQEAYGQEPQVILTVPLLIGTDGERAMSQSRGNYIGVDEEPKEMYGKVMSIPDGLIIHYFTLVTDLLEAKIKEMERALAEDSVNPRDLKMRLAQEIVAQFHGKEAAQGAEEEFKRVFQKGELPEEVATKELSLSDQVEMVLRGPDGKIKEARVPAIDLLIRTGLVNTRSEARRLIDQGGVRLNGEKVQGLDPVLVKEGTILQVGKRKFIKLSLEEKTG